MEVDFKMVQSRADKLKRDGIQDMGGKGSERKPAPPPNASEVPSLMPAQTAPPKPQAPAPKPQAPVQAPKPAAPKVVAEPAGQKEKKREWPSAPVAGPLKKTASKAKRQVEGLATSLNIKPSDMKGLLGSVGGREVLDTVKVMKSTGDSLLGNNHTDGKLNLDVMEYAARNPKKADELKVEIRKKDAKALREYMS